MKEIKLQIRVDNALVSVTVTAFDLGIEESLVDSRMESRLRAYALKDTADGARSVERFLEDLRDLAVLIAPKPDKAKSIHEEVMELFAEDQRIYGHCAAKSYAYEGKEGEYEN